MNGPADQEQHNELNNRSTEMHLVVGAQHIRSKVKHARNNNYTFTTALNELVDYPILIANRVDITLQKNGEGTGLYKIKISDDCPGGFEYILDTGSKNPFNFGYETEDHDNDDTISEFGTGMKQAAVSIGDKFTVITKVNDEYFLIQFEYQKMMLEADVMKSYNPTLFRSMSKEEYNQYHPYEQGSTLILESVLQNILSSSSIENLEKKTKESLSNTYSKILSKRKNDLILTLNGEQIHENEDIYSTDECRPFTKQIVIIIKKDMKGDPEFLEYSINEEENKIKYRIYNDTGLYKIVKGRELTRYLDLPDYYENGKISYKNVEGMILIRGTGTQFSSKINDANLPKGITNIYRQGRHQGCLTTGSANGAKNYVKTELEYNNKCLGKQYGTNYNKTINFKKDTLFTKATQESINNLTSSLQYDTSTKTAEKFYLKARELNIQVHESKIPTKYKTQVASIVVSNEHEIPNQCEEKKDEESNTLTDVEYTSQHALAEELGIGEGASDDNETIIEEPANEPTEELDEEPAEEPVNEPTEEPANEPTEEPDEEPAEEPVNEPTEEPANEPTEEPANDPVDTTRQPCDVVSYRKGSMKVHEYISALERELKLFKTKDDQDDITDADKLKIFNKLNN